MHDDTSSPKSRPWLRRKKVLLELDIADSTLWSWIRKGQFPPPATIGQLQYWPADVVDAHIRKLQQEAAGPVEQKTRHKRGQTSKSRKHDRSHTAE